ncbi:D-alanine--D-alanine ligase [Candidatus Dependentiae bacterium]|nr:D-alanine--D-alanine ligase [Candidatus Dependentiae bacterium]
MAGVAHKLKLRVGVLMGGRSIEREVSFNSGRTICDHLDTQRFDIIPIFQKDNGQVYLLPWHFLHRGKISDFYNRLDLEAKKISWDDLKDIVDFVYLALHGRYGEDGTVQGILEIMKIPYLGSKVFGSALVMDKVIQKNILKSNGIYVPNDLVVRSFRIKNLKLKDVLQELKIKKISFPVVVKPAHEGSSFGVNVVKNESNLLKAINDASSCSPDILQDVIIEEKLDGMEFVSVCLQKEDDSWFGLSVTEVITEKGYDFYDYTQKYMPGRATKITPARCSEEKKQEILNVCLRVTKLLNFSDISRIDGFIAEEGKIYIIDPNSITGMSPSSFLFNQAAEIGMNHTQLINYLIDIELKRYGIIKKDSFKNNMNKIKNKKRIVVLLGGDTNEREISLESGRNICYKLSPHKYDVIPVFVDINRNLHKLTTRLLVQNSTKEISEMLTDDLKLNWSDLPKICDFVFIALHGGIGENGSVQGILEMLNLPYNGSGVLASSLCMDKFKTSEYLKSKGLEVAQSILLNKTEWEKNKSLNFLKNKTKNLSYTLVLKPHNDGCSFFVEKIKNEKELFEKLDLYFKNSGKDIALIEEFISGMELTCGAFGNNKIISMPPSKVLAIKDILSIEEKFLPGTGENLTPAPLPQKVLKFIQGQISSVYKELNLKGYARIDCFYQNEKISPTKKERLVILEVNNLPGMTPATAIFHQAAEIGLKPMEFVDKIVELGFELHEKKYLQKNKSKRLNISG